MRSSTKCACCVVIGAFFVQSSPARSHDGLSWSPGEKDSSREWLSAYLPRLVEPWEQTQNTTCAPVSVDFVARYLERYYAARFSFHLDLPEYVEIQKGLWHGDQESGISSFVSSQAVIDYWNSVVAPRAQDWYFYPRRGCSVDDLLIALNETRRPVIVSYLMPFGSADFLRFVRGFFRVVTLGASEFIVEPMLPLGKDGENILHAYLHSSVLVAASRSTATKDGLLLYLADPWTGKICVWQAEVFQEYWLNYEVADSEEFYVKRVKPMFEKLAPPGSFIIMKQARKGSQ